MLLHAVDQRRAADPEPARRLGLVAAHGGHASLTDGLNRRENHQRIEEEINQHLELAVQYQIPNLIVFAGNRNGMTDEEGAANTAEGLRRVAKAAEVAREPETAIRCRPGNPNVPTIVLSYCPGFLDSGIICVVWIAQES